MDVLIVKLGALGDVLRTTSVVRQLKRCRPDARVTWVTARAALPLLEGNPDLERVLALEDKPKLERRYPLVLSLEEDRAAAHLALAACSGELIGVLDEAGLRYTDSSALYYDMSALNRDPDGTLKTADKLKAANRLGYARIWLKILGLPAPKKASDLRPVLALTDRERKEAARGLCLTGAKTKLTRAIGLNAGAGIRWPAKQLSVGSAARLADALASLGRPVILLGGADEKKRNRDIAAASGDAVVDAGTGRSLRGFAGLLSWLAAIVTTDSLAFHIATALGVPTVVLVGPTSAPELELFGAGASVRPQSCNCFYKPECLTPPSCLDSLSTARVTAAVSKVLA